MDTIKLKSGKIVTRRETVINHAKAKKLRISPTQYVMMELIHEFILKHGKITTCDLSEIMYMYNIDMVNSNAGILKGQQLIELHKDLNNKSCYGYITVTAKWTDYSGINSLDVFAKLWTHYSQAGKERGWPVGNRKKAEEMWQRTVKAGTKPLHILMDYWPLYKKFILQTDTKMMHCSSWLNPVYKKFKDEYVIKKDDSKNKSQIGQFTGRRA